MKAASHLTRSTTNANSLRPTNESNSSLLNYSSFEQSGTVSLLLPLRDRDLKELTDLFTQDEIEAIEADILHNLMRRAPEPCWEEEPYDFLKEYL